MKRLALAAIAASRLQRSSRNSRTAPTADQPTAQHAGASPANTSASPPARTPAATARTEPLNATHVLQNEFYTWLNNDRHAQAYNVLFNDRSARIAKNMRLKKSAYEENALPRLPHHQRPRARRSPAPSIPRTACSARSATDRRRGWRAEHTEEGWTHEQSVARGMIDLRDLPVRAHDLPPLPPRQRGKGSRSRADRLRPSRARVRARQLHRVHAAALDVRAATRTACARGPSGRW